MSSFCSDRSSVPTHRCVKCRVTWPLLKLIMLPWHSELCGGNDAWVLVFFDNGNLLFKHIYFLASIPTYPIYY